MGFAAQNCIKAQQPDKKIGQMGRRFKKVEGYSAPISRKLLRKFHKMWKTAIKECLFYPDLFAFYLRNHDFESKEMVTYQINQTFEFRGCNF